MLWNTLLYANGMDTLDMAFKIKMHKTKQFSMILCRRFCSIMWTNANMVISKIDAIFLYTSSGNKNLLQSDFNLFMCQHNDYIQSNYYKIFYFRIQSSMIYIVFTCMIMIYVEGNIVET